MTEQPQVNTKTLPPHPTAEELYNYVYNRKQRRSHSAEKKAEIKRKLWDNYNKQLREAAAKLKVKEEAADGGEDTTIHESAGEETSTPRK